MPTWKYSDLFAFLIKFMVIGRPIKEQRSETSLGNFYKGLIPHWEISAMSDEICNKNTLSLMGLFYGTTLQSALG